MKRRATTYFRKSKIYAHSTSVTTAGVGIATGPFESIEATTNPTEIGEFVGRILRGSREEVEHPRNWGKILAPLLKEAGCSTWSVFFSQAKCVEILEYDDATMIIPTQKHLDDKSFERLDSKVISVRSRDTNDVGASLLRAFEIAPFN